MFKRHASVVLLPQGQYTKQGGLLGYNEICESLETGRPPMITMWDSAAKAEYAYQDSKWISYDSVRTMEEKAEYALELGLAGMFMWSIDTEDFGNKCREGRYPLLTEINRMFAEKYV